MKLKRIMIIALLILAVLTVGSVSASDNLTDTVELSDEVISSPQEDILGETDDGTFTALQQKINDAGAGSTIVLENDYRYNEGFSTGGIQISYDGMTIDGNGHTIDGMSKSRIFQITDDTNIVIKNLKFKNGYSTGSGGAIRIYTVIGKGVNLNLHNCEFENNVAKNGGAIFGMHYVDMIAGAFSSPICIIDGCTFKGNVASGSGGAIIDTDTGDNNWIIRNSQFISNRAGDYGGAVFSKLKGLQILDCKFENNVASKVAGAVFIGRTYYQSTTVNGVHYTNVYLGGENSKIVGCEFKNNNAEKGGSIYWWADNGVLNSSTFTYNNGYEGYAVYWYGGENGAVNDCKLFTSSDKVKTIFVNSPANETIKLGDFTVTFIKSGSGSGNVKKTPKIIAKKKTFKAKTKIKKYRITLKDNKGKPIKKVKVSLKVKGKTYKAKTNKKGKATFKIKNLAKKGTYKAIVTFKGNKHFKKVTKKVKIKVK